MKKELAKAYKLYEDFREAKPKRIVRLNYDDVIPKSLMSIGNLVEVRYDTTRGGKVEKYQHKFHAGSRPLLCASDTGLLYIIGGRYEVTERGIVDLDGQGNELE